MPAVYPKFKEQCLQGGVNLSTGTVDAYLIDGADYTYAASHEFLSSVLAAARVAGPVSLTTKTFVNGLFDAADITFSSVTGDGTEHVLLVLRGTGDADSRLIALLDGTVTPDGNNINCTWNASGIFQL